MPGKNRWSSTVYTGTCSERIALSGLLVVTAAAMLVAPLSARGTENTPESSHIFATEAVTATGNASPAEEIGSIVAATAQTRNPAETSPQPPTTGAGGCGKPNAPGRYAYRLEHGDAQTGKKCGDPARRLRTGHCAALAGGLPAARFPRTLRHLDRQDAARLPEAASRTVRSSSAPTGVQQLVLGQPHRPVDAL